MYFVRLMNCFLVFTEVLSNIYLTPIFINVVFVFISCATQCLPTVSCPLVDCGGPLNNPAGGNFTSPGYLVSNYSDNLNCEWLIQNPQHINSSIVVLIEDLHLENHQTCESDYLQFRLGKSHKENCLHDSLKYVTCLTF